MITGPGRLRGGLVGANTRTSFSPNEVKTSLERNAVASRQNNIPESSSKTLKVASGSLAFCSLIDCSLRR